MKLWIDDVRPMPKGYSGNDDWAQTSIEAINMLRARSLSDIAYEEISFDHDLGLLDNGETDDTRKVMSWMVQNGVWPQHVYVHTANPVGREWLLGTAGTYAPASTVVHYI